MTPMDAAVQLLIGFGLIVVGAAILRTTWSAKASSWVNCWWLPPDYKHRERVERAMAYFAAIMAILVGVAIVFHGSHNAR